MQLRAYKRTPIWNPETVPVEITNKHNTKVGTWGQIKVLKGKLQFEALSEQGDVLSTTVYDAQSVIPMVQPQAWHRVSLLTEDTAFFVEFFCSPEDYLAKKYGYTRTHSEVIAALETISQPCKVLDLGCGRGGNALYLAQKGFDVTALDANPESLALLEEVMELEDLDLQVASYDINSASLTESYDFILSTVVFMFLEADRVPAIIRNMQDQTNPGGYHLIVAAMDTADAPCPMNFNFTFAQGELRDYYQDWELITYNEDFGQLHKRDRHGNRMTMRFATLLARKIK